MASPHITVEEDQKSGRLFARDRIWMVDFPNRLTSPCQLEGSDIVMNKAMGIFKRRREGEICRYHQWLTVHISIFELRHIILAYVPLLLLPAPLSLCPL
jgi:hypothetical protein